MKRRKFLTASAQGLFAAPSLTVLAGENLARAAKLHVPHSSEIDPNDEKFWGQVREQFPLRRNRIYLNNGGLGPSPFPVIDTVQKMMGDLEEISETGHSAALWQKVKTSCAKILGCSSEELASTRNATEGINIVCNGLPLRSGDEIITSTHEHVGNTISWLARQKRDGVRVRVFEPSMISAQENLDRIEALISPKTRVLSVMHVSTATGQILPLKEIGEIAQKHNLWYFVDGAQSAGMTPVNLQEIGCHAFATSGHKWLLGPKGTGLLYVRKDMLDTIEAKWVGAYSNEGSFDMKTGEFHFHPSAQRYEYGTVNAPLFAGLGAAADFLLQIGIQNVWRRNLALTNKLKNGLQEVGVDYLSPRYKGGLGSMMTFRVPGVERAALQKFLAEKHKLRTRGIYEGGLDGVRISLHIYNSFAEIDQILAAVREAKKL